MSGVRSLLVVALIMLAPAQATAAGPWLVAELAELPATDDVVGLSLRPDGRGFAVSAGGGFARIYQVTHTLTEGPQLVLLDEPAVTIAPRMAYDGTWVVVSGPAVGTVRRGSLAGSFVSRAASWLGGPIRAIALDPGGSGRGLLSFDNGGLIANASRSEDAFDTYFDLEIGSSSSGVTALAVHADTGFAVANGGIHVSPSVSTGAWVPLTADGGPAATLAGSNVDGAFLTVGAAGMAQLVPPSLDSVIDCADPGADITAIAALEADFWLGRDDGVIDVIDACPWHAVEQHFTGLARVSALAALDSRVLLAIGEGLGGTALAWRNRPPLTPTITGGGDLDEGASAALAATARDPDLTAGADDPHSFEWSCDASLSASGTTSDTVAVTGPSLCVNPAAPTARTTYSCTLVTTDSDAQSSEAASASVAVLPLDTIAPTVQGVSGLQADQTVLVGTTLSLSAQASDDDDTCLFQASWLVSDEASGVAREQASGVPWNAPFVFSAATLGAEQLTRYTLQLIVTDTAGNEGALLPFAFAVAQPQAPLEVALACPATLEAGATATATATPEPGSGTVLDYAWQVSGGLVADPAPNDASFTFDTDVCAGGSQARVTMIAHGVFEDTSEQSCDIELLEPAAPPPPRLSIIEAPELVVALGEADLALALRPQVLACADDDVEVHWQLDALPLALRPAGLDASGLLALPRDQPLELVAGPEAFALLVDSAHTVRAWAVDHDSELASTPVEVTLRFIADTELTGAAGAQLSLTIDEQASVEDGALLALRGAVTTDLAVALPALTLTLAGAGLAAVPGSVTVTSACGARGSATHQGKDAILNLEGVSRACPAELRLLARRGLGGGGISARACAWGTNATPLLGCEGGLALQGEAALSCSSGAAPPLAPLLLLVLLGVIPAITGRHRPTGPL